MQFFRVENGKLIFRRRREIVEISAWGAGLRVRATENRSFYDLPWALEENLSKPADILFDGDDAIVKNGRVHARITSFGKLSFFDGDKLLLKEYYRSWEYGTAGWRDLDQITQARETGRTYRSLTGDYFRVSVRFEPQDEKLFGMGQYQQPTLDLKGSTLQLEQKNTQASVPFLLSSRGYGFFWNNPAIGRANLGTNLTEFIAECSRQIDYWVTAGTPEEILANYTEVVGRPPMMPDYAMGFWQCKLRYQTQDELMAVAREYHRRNIPVGVIVVDFFHWPQQGDWRFDERYWPDPKGMAQELSDMGMKLMVSVWPTVDRASVHYTEMMERDLLVRVDRGIPVTMDCFGFEQFIDMTNPESQKYIWNICKENYFDLGVSLFWLDEAEPEYTKTDWDIYRYYDGQALECANVYPAKYAKAFYDGEKACGVEEPVNLIRCAWASSAKYGALVWSGDVPSTFTYLKYQYAAAQNMAMAGIPWWTADIGGFHGGNIHDPAFHEVLMRWFQFGTYLPVMRLHGDRDPHDKLPLGKDGGGMCFTGADNEVWAYPPEVSDMMVKYIQIRERMKPYTRKVMEEAHLYGKPVVRPLFYEFPHDACAWEDHEEYLFGPDVLVCPVLHAGIRLRDVYFPKGATWIAEDGTEYEGGTRASVAAPLDTIPVFRKKKEFYFD